MVVITILVGTLGARLFYGELLDLKKMVGLTLSLVGVLLRIHYETIMPWMHSLAPALAHLFARHLALTDEVLAYI